MIGSKSYHRRNVLIVVIMFMIISIALTGRLAYLMIFKSVYYGQRAKELHERERPIKAERGSLYDCNNTEIASNKPVCTISVIHSQIKNPERVISVLSKELEISEEKVRKRVEKVSSIERVKSNVSKEIADKIRKYDLQGVMIDEDYKRFYPYNSLASKVIGFTGSDNQGIVGLEVKYDKYLQGLDGYILTQTTARGVEIENAAEDRKEPVAGKDVHLSLDINIQKYAEQVAKRAYEEKKAKSVKVIVMNPQNGELTAMVNYPEFNLNDPYTLNYDMNIAVSDKKKNELLNQMWRNGCLSDTYEPGSAFKIVTATGALEEGVVKLTDRFYCPGYKKVEDRIIRCHKVGGHGSETFVDGIKNSCNPVFMELGARLGVKNMYKYFDRLGLFKKTGIDLPGEASSIMHNIKNVKAVELATMSFGQGFQITPLQLMSAVSTVINGGNQITPHFGVSIRNKDGSLVKDISYQGDTNVISKKTSDTMKDLLEQVVATGTGHRAYLPGFRIGGKTATSQKLPRGNGKYIASFIGFAPANNPKVLALVMIDEPQGLYYGGTIAAPRVQELFDNILPYMGIEPDYSEKEIKDNNIGEVTIPNLLGKTKKEVKELTNALGIESVYYSGKGDVVTEQFPLAGEVVKKNTDLILYLE
ncbi:cell division protein FtsI [peptidoglycan synthetase] [Lachnospiraceae bacterium KM106-2]|nr:cell division protein FtsI [peptidoglycan synthetase] [Lachnospiraceae bacterium KM106-2]